MEERAQLAWLARRVGWGVAPGQLDEWESLGVDTVLDHLTDPDANGIPADPDPFDGLQREFEEGSDVLRESVGAWIAGVVETNRPLETWMQFFWHDFFAVSARVVRIPGLMFDHFSLLRREGMGNFRTLLADMTVDGAMLGFLDGTTSTGEAPNENYGREMLELYSVGVGNFTEDDVKAAARALTGWVVARRLDGEVFFVERRHDDTPQTLLGIDGVNDVETVVNAAVDHPATAPRIVRLLANRILGTGVDQAVLDRRTESFAADFELRPLVRGLLEDGLDGAGTDVIIEPFPWFVSVTRATQTPLRGEVVGRALFAAGQIPFLPPNVGGFPPPTSYLGTSATIARFNLASDIAKHVRTATPVAEAAEAADLPALADALGLVDGFSPATADALGSLTDPVDRLAVALASPDLIVA